MPTAHRGGAGRLALAFSLVLLAATPRAGEPGDAGMTAGAISAGGAPAVAMIRVRSLDTGEARLGSGFFVDPSGMLVTALHLIDGAESVLVRTAGGKRFREVAVRAYDVDADVVVLQVAGDDLPAVELGSSAGLASGDPIVVIGNPLALVRTVTEGIVSAWRDPEPEPPPDEEIAEDAEFGGRRRLRAAPNTRILQLSAAMSLGSSGAPVFDRTGKVVAMALAVVSHGELDLNFAIPVEQIAPLLARDEGLTLSSLERQAGLAREVRAEPHVARARLALELGEDAEAQRAVDAALQMSPGSIEALLVQSELLRRRGETAAAEEVLLELTRRSPESTTAWYELGELRLEILEGSGLSLAPAREALERVMELEPGHGEAAHGLGIIAYHEGRLRSSTRYLEQAHEADPEHAETRLWLGEVYLRAGRAGEAQSAFAEALELGADRLLGLHGMARAYAALGQDERSREHFREFLRHTEGDPDYEALRERTILYLRRYAQLMPLEYVSLLDPRRDSG